MLAEEFGELGQKDELFVKVVSLLEFKGVLARYEWKGVGCPPHERTWLLYAFLAMQIYQFPNREALYEAICGRPTLRRLCGWDSVAEVPSLSTFCRAFAQFAQDGVMDKIHEALVKTHCGPKLAGHVSRDATAIAVRERPPVVTKAVAAPALRYKRGRPKKGEQRPPAPTPRLQLQSTRSLAENLADLPRQCDSGGKQNSKGHMEFWRGYKLHLDVIDGDIPVSAVLTSASTHDSQVAIPLMQMTAQRVQSLYQLMDAAYDAEDIRQYARKLGQVPIIDPKHRGQWVPLEPAQRRRFHERSASERVNSLLKDYFGGRTVRVRGAAKELPQLMLGVIAITAMNLWNRLC
jgi:IS5 family transposase